MWGTDGNERMNLWAIFSYGLLYMDTPVLADQQRLTYISSVQTVDAAKRTFLEWWIIGIDSKRDSVQSTQLDIDDDDIYICMYVCVCVCVLRNKTWKLVGIKTV